MQDDAAAGVAVHEHDHDHDHAEEKLPITVETADAGPARKTLTITVPADAVAKRVEDAYGTLSDDAVLPGFRRGRAPRRLLERKFKDAVRGDVKQRLITEAYQQACEEQKLDVIGDPELPEGDKLELPEQGDLTFRIEVEVTPEVKLPEFSTIKVKKPSAQVADADIDQEIEQLRERFGTMAPAEEGATIEDSDYVQCDVTVLPGEDAADDAEPIATAQQVYTQAHGEKLEFRGHVAGIVVPDLGKHLIGKPAGETLRINMTGPSGHENEKIKNQPITVVLKLLNIQRLQPAEVTALVQNMGVEDEAALRERVREVLERRKQARQRTEMHRQAAEQLVDAVSLDLPEGVKGRQVERLLARRRMELLYGGESPDGIETRLAELRGQSEQDAVRQLKAFFVINQAAKELEVEVDHNEINGQIAMLAMQQGRRPEKLRQEMMQRGEIEQLYLSIREGKTLDKVLEKAEVTDEA